MATGLRRTLAVLLAATFVLALWSAESQAHTTGLARAIAVAGGPAKGQSCQQLLIRRAKHRSARRRPAEASRVERCAAKTGKKPKPAPAPTLPAPIATQVTEPLAIGIDGGWGGWSEDEIQERVELGAAVTRHEWSPSEPVNAQDEIVLDAAARIHTRIYALLGADELGDPNHYREYVISFIRRYGIGGTFWAEHPELDASRYAITTFELGNEPYYGGMSATEYAATVRPVLEEVQRLGLPAKIVLASRVYGSDTSWMETLYQAIPNLNALYYGLAEHPYWYGHDPSQTSVAGPFDRITTLRTKMNELGAAAKPIMISEYGESTGDCGSECVSEAEQAQHLGEMIQAVTTNPQWGIGLLSVFQLNDYSQTGTEREGSFGLLRTDGTPKPAYYMVREALSRFRG